MILLSHTSQNSNKTQTDSIWPNWHNKPRFTKYIGSLHIGHLMVDFVLHYMSRDCVTKDKIFVRICEIAQPASAFSVVTPPIGWILLIFAK